VRPAERASRFLRCAGVLALALTAQPRPAGADDPDLEYSTISTEHFRIHFHQGLEEMARDLASIAEEVHVELSILMGWEVDGPTEVVLTDRTDDANGSAMVTPRPIIRLFAAPPTSDSALATHADWLRTLFTHEYTHVIQLQMHSGVSRVVNAIFGDVYLPNQMQPLWFIEGMAVMEETYRNGTGRIRSAEFRSTLRMNALEGKLLSLGEASNDVRQYPRGSNPYIYGAMFVDYLRTRFGEEKLYAICHEYGSSTVPYAMNRVFKRVLGVELVDLYDEWLAGVRREAEATAKALEAKGITRSERLTGNAEYKGQPIFSRDGRALLLSIADGQTRSGLFELPLDGGPRRRLALAGSDAHLSSDRRGNLFYTRGAPYKEFYRYGDVFVLPASGGEPRRVTYGARAREAAVSPSGRELALVVDDGGGTKLVLADERGQSMRDLLVPARHDQVYDPSWSPDGRAIAAVVRQGPRVDVVMIDVESGKTTPVTDDAGNESAPVFDPSGRWIVFSSDRTGVDDIFAVDLEGGSLRQLTNVLGGATAPAVSPDGEKLAFLDFTTAGRDVRIAEFDPLGAEVVTRAPLPETARTPVARPASKAVLGPYNPLPSLLPRYWMLGMQTGGGEVVLQATTSMNDAVGHHAIAAELDYALDADAWTVRAAYAYYGMTPSVHVGIGHWMAPREEGYLVGGEKRSWEQEITRGTITLSASVPGLDRSHSISAAYEVTYARPRDGLDVVVDPSGPLPDLPLQYFRAGLQLGWLYSDVEWSVSGISAEAGRNVWASVSIDHPAFGSDQKIAGFSYGWAEYLEMPWLDHHVLALRLNGGVYVSDPPEQAAFYVGSYSEQNIVDALWSNVSMGLPSLRGYPAGRFAGDQYHLARLEYRFPIWWFEAAYKTVPLFFRELHAGVFTDNALVTFGALDRDDWRSSVGGELVWTFRFGYFMPITLRTGYARGLMAGGINDIIIVLGGSF
jgi:Tol biopolymer transport system component